MTLSTKLKDWWKKQALKADYNAILIEKRYEEINLWERALFWALLIMVNPSTKEIKFIILKILVLNKYFHHNTA